MTALVVRADARNLPLADSSVDLIVTSPPYFGLRSYTDGGEHYAGQVGDEATPQEFLEALWACTAEWLRVLKPSGSLWVNLGDKYSGYNNGSGKGRSLGTQDRSQIRMRNLDDSANPSAYGIPNKSLMGMPWRYALGCIDQLGLILRAEVIWSKPNGLPESVTDRVRRSHEQWFHFTKEPRYFSAVDEIREATTDYKAARPLPLSQRGQVLVPGNTPRSTDGLAQTSMVANPLGKLPSSVWEIATEPLRVPPELGVDHFAAFPTEWPRRIIAGWSPAGICTACGEGRRPVVASRRCVDGESVQDLGGRRIGGYQSEAAGIGNWRFSTERSLEGYACACPDTAAPTRPSVILDPFGGTGTTALVASALGRTGISVDLSHDYSRLARWRTTDPGERAKALRVDKPPAQVDGQQDLFAELP